MKGMLAMGPAFCVGDKVKVKIFRRVGKGSVTGWQYGKITNAHRPEREPGASPRWAYDVELERGGSVTGASEYDLRPDRRYT